MQRGLRLIGWILLAMLAGTSLVYAESDSDTARKLREAGDILPLETILHKLNQTHPGKVLEVEFEREHGKVIYEIEMLDDKGEVWQLKVDPRTGDILQKKQEH